MDANKANTVLILNNKMGHLIADGRKFASNSEGETIFYLIFS